MSAGHHHSPGPVGRTFALGVGPNLGFVATEATFGILAQSLALLADASPSPTRNEHHYGSEAHA